MNNALQQVIQKFSELKKLKKYKNFEYNLPNRWFDFDSNSIKTITNPCSFYEEFLTEIDSNELARESFPETEKVICYNLYVRYSTAFDHNQDGELSIESEDFRETGTFIKTMLLIPYLKKMGVNVVHLLPVTSIGKDGIKGNMGSPYAIRNPYKIEETLAEPALELSPEIQFSALMIAFKKAGIKVILEFVFRTASIDSDLSLENPHWFYWIKNRIKNRTADSNSPAQYGSPIFNKKELKKIKEMVKAEKFTNLPEPNEQYRQMFMPSPGKVARVEGRVIGVINKKEEVRIPPAFADWPPDDIQPAWDDVTYLKLYNNDKFNYIAYNTIRMYDTNLSLSDQKNDDLWRYIEEILPFYISNFGLDGAMIDMGHSLPPSLLSAIIKKAKQANEEFIFWEENFNPSRKSLELGYSAIMGYLSFDQHIPQKLNSFLSRLENKEIEPTFFATPENHNTPRAASRIDEGIAYSELALVVNSFLPCIFFISSGIEIGETRPINTGLDFSAEEIEKYPATELPLFSAVEMNWQNDNSLMNVISKLALLKSEYKFEDSYLKNLSDKDSNYIAYKRKISNGELFVLANFHSENVRIEYHSIFNLEPNLEKLEILLSKHLVQNDIFELGGMGYAVVLIKGEHNE